MPLSLMPTRRLSLSVAYVAVDNISHALGNFIDDQQWHSLGLLFARDGWRAKAAVAFCVGPEHAEECERNYDGVAALPRASASGHWLIQPVIDVAPDGNSAKMRHRLLHIDAAPESRGFSDGMYPNNAAKLEDGVWKFDVAAPDQPYFSSSGFRDGWARRSTTPPGRAPNRNAIEPLRNFPPDVPRASCRSVITARCRATRSSGRTSSRCGFPTGIRSAAVCRLSTARTSRLAKRISW